MTKYHYVQSYGRLLSMWGDLEIVLLYSAVYVNYVSANVNQIDLPHVDHTCREVSEFQIKLAKALGLWRHYSNTLPLIFCSWYRSDIMIHVQYKAS